MPSFPMCSMAAICSAMFLVRLLCFVQVTPMFTETFREQVLSLDDKCSLRCSAAGSPLPMITWTLDGLPLETRKADLYSLRRALWGDYVMFDEGQVVSHVNLTANSVFDGGLFSCTASNSVGSVTHSAMLRVLGQTQVRPMHNKMATAGQSIVLNCHTVGDEPVAIEWYKDGQRVPFNHRQRVNKNGSLDIMSLDKVIDSGNYSCSAQAGHKYQSENVQSSIELKVKVPPVIESFKFDSKLQQGMRTRVYCNMAQGDVPVKLSWAKDGCPLSDHVHYNMAGLHVRQIDEFSLALVIENLSTHHNGNYSCLAENEAASVNHTSELLVNVPPSWLVEPKSLLVVEGTPATIDCMAQGFPTPQVTWKRLVHTNEADKKSSQYQLIRSGPHYQVYENGTLRISKSLLADRGNYLCQATNGIGPGLSTMVQLAVNIAARFESLDKQENLTVTKGHWLELGCRAYGDPPISVQWTRNVQGHLDKLVQGAEARYFFSEESTSQGVTSKLNITGASRLDSTVFKCTASNAFGSDIKVVNVRVEESPEPPFDFQLESKSSRSVSLRWRSPYNGNSPLIEFMVNVKPEARDDNHVLASDFAPMANPGPERNITVSGNATSAIISHLQPATKYTFVAVSRNAVGASGPSKPLAVATDEEAPGGSAVNVQLETLDATSIKVTWEPPRAELVNGVIKGYYIGYKVVNSSQHFVYKTVQSSIGSPSVGSIGPAIASSGLSLTLRALQPFTSYSIIVQAFNAVGAGPRTEEIRTRTGECGPSSPPLQVRCLPMSAQSLKISWDPMGPERTNGFLRGYKLFYRPLAARSYGQLDQLRARTDLVRGDETNLILTDLLKYTNYSIRVAAFTTEDGPYSPDVQCRTNEDIPGPPQAIKVAQASGDSAAICWREPSTANGLVRSYTVYRKSWPEESVMSYTVPDHTKYYTSTGLIKGKRYSYWVTASTVIGEGPATPSFTQTSSDIGAATIMAFGGHVDGQTGSSVDLACRAVGIPSPTIEWRLNGKPVLAKPSINGQVNDDGRNVQHKLASGTLRLSGLLGQDEGNYSCHATNGHGSDSVVYQVTVDRDKGQSEEESPPPVIRIANTTAKSIIVEWKSKAFPSSSLSNLMFYSPLAVAQEVYFKNVISTASEWKQLVLNENGHDNGSFTINNLVCGTQYKVYSVLVYPVGKSRPSQVVIGKTQGREPLSSPASVFITRLDKNAVQLNLNTWRNGGCPLIEGQVQWRNVQDKPWNVLAINSLSEPVVLSGLNSEHLYKIRVTLKNTAGTTTVEYEARTSPFKISNVMYRSPSDTSEHISLDSYNVVHGDDAAIQGPLIVTSFVTLILLLAALLSVIVLYKTIQNKLVHGNHGHIISTNSVAMAHSHPANTKIPFMSNVGPSDFVSGAELAVLTVPAHEASTLCSRTRKQQQKKLRTSCSDTAFDALTSFGPNDQDQVLETPYQYLTVSRTSFSGPHKKLPPLNGGEYATVDKKNYTKAKMNSSNHHASGLPSVVSLGLGISNFSGHGGHQDQSSSPRYSTPKTPTSGLILDETINFDQRLSVLTACDSIASSDNGHEQSQHQQHGGYCYTSVLNDPHADGGYSYPGNQHWPDKHDFRSKQHDDSMLFN